MDQANCAHKKSTKMAQICLVLVEISTPKAVHRTRRRFRWYNSKGKGISEELQHRAPEFLSGFWAPAFNIKQLRFWRVWIKATLLSAGPCGLRAEHNTLAFLKGLAKIYLHFRRIRQTARKKSQNGTNLLDFSHKVVIQTSICDINQVLALYLRWLWAFQISILPFWFLKLETAINWSKHIKLVVVHVRFASKF